MDLRGLNIFIQVAELNSFTRAGEKLGYSQPTVSFQIKQLEQELGVQLFDRIGHTVSLTHSGRTALAYAQHIVQLSQEMHRGARGQLEPHGEVRLAMADSLCEPLIVKGFSELRSMYPNINLHVTTSGTAEMFRLLDHNEVDLVCTLDNHIYNSTYVIADEEKVNVHFVVSTKNPLAKQSVVSIDDILSLPFILTEKGMSYRRLLDENLARTNRELHPVLELGRVDSICRLVEEDMGVSFLPEYVTEESVRSGKLARLKVEGLEVELWKQVLYHRDKWVSQHMQVVLEHISKYLKTH